MKQHYRMSNSDSRVTITGTFFAPSSHGGGQITKFSFPVFSTNQHIYENGILKYLVILKHSVKASQLTFTSSKFTTETPEGHQ